MKPFFLIRLFAINVLALVFLAQPRLRADDAPTPPPPEPNYVTNDDGTLQTNPIHRGLRIFTCGNSFHWYTPPIVKQMAESVGITGEKIVGISQIGGSRAIQHWDIPDEKNEAKAALKAGKVDVLTLACMLQPDEGIENFAKLGLKSNPNIRVALQEFWIPSDKYEWPYHGDINKVDFDASTIPDLRKMHEPYFKGMDDYVRALNAKFDHQVVFAIPAGQAILNLREKIVNGQMPGIDKQSELFVDKIGHPSPPLQALVSYCNFAVIYRQSPVGMPMPAVLANAHNPKWDDRTNRVLQQLAWDAVTHQPLSGLPQASTTGE